jgi:hypothetical protein
LLIVVVIIIAEAGGDKEIQFLPLPFEFFFIVQAPVGGVGMKGAARVEQAGYGGEFVAAAVGKVLLLIGDTAGMVAEVIIIKGAGQFVFVADVPFDTDALRLKAEFPSCCSRVRLSLLGLKDWRLTVLMVVVFSWALPLKKALTPK